jgi:nucleotide-binding universal stress UspA family protein
MAVKGNFRILILYDVAELFDLSKLQQAIGPAGGEARPSFSRRTPEYVRFERAPIVEPVDNVALPSGETLPCTLRYYSYAVVVAQITVPFHCDWDSLIEQAARWINTSELEPLARGVVAQRLYTHLPGVARPEEKWLQESYFIVELAEILEHGTDRPTAADVVATHGADIVKVIRGETHTLAPKAVADSLESRISYYDCDLIVISSTGALVYDAPDDAAEASAILEYAKMQLLEFRYYDNLLTRLLSQVYDALEMKRNPLFSRWTIPRDAKRLNTIRLDAMELTERVDNAIKFVSDVFYARVYRMAETRMGVSEYRELVDEKLKTIKDLYDFMIDQYNENRSFVIEVAVAILALLDVIFLFKGFG